ncbi:MAG: dihydrofolate reductase [Saprospiraceae bacterium]|nr:dihydrofolate reductase [Saprospiraceae bacterium]
MKKQIALIAAMSENRVIGLHNRLPWHLPADWEHFRRTTSGAPFIMGRKSYETADALLSDYKNVIISNSENLALCSHCKQAHSVAEALQLLADEPLVFILGGAQVFEQTIHLADLMYLTIVHHQFDGDAFFPEVNWAEWELLKQDNHPTDERHAYAFSINVYKRIA